MAFNRLNLTSNVWTQVATGVTVANFQNVGSMGIYVQTTTGTTPPVEAFGWVYAPGFGEINKDMSNFGGDTIWARSVSGTSKVVVKT